MQSYAQESGEQTELYPGGPRIFRGKSEMVINLGMTPVAGHLRAVYGENSELLQLETYNGRGVKISTAHFREILLTEFDLGETGHTTRWEYTSYDRNSTKTEPTMIRTVYELDSATGERREMERKTVPGIQSCEGGVNTVSPAIDNTVNIISKHVQTQAACDKALAGMSVQDKPYVDHKFVAVSGAPVCIDESCGAAGEDFGNFVKTTVTEGAACLARLGRNSKADDKALAGIAPGKPLAANNAAFLKKNFATRNAALMLMMFNQNENIGSVFNADEQLWLTDYDKTPKGSMTVGEQKEVAKLGKPSAGPIKFACGELGYNLEVKDPKYPSKSFLYPDGKYIKGSASLPGMPGWPMIRLRKDIARSGGKTETSKAVLFHEMLHLLGFPHDEAGAVGTPPIHTACQICCFPEGNKAGDCTAAEAKQATCGICANDPAATYNQEGLDAAEKKKRKDAYSAIATKCYDNHNAF